MSYRGNDRGAIATSWWCKGPHGGPDSLVLGCMAAESRAYPVISLRLTP